MAIFRMGSRNFCGDLHVFQGRKEGRKEGRKDGREGREEGRRKEGRVAEER